MILHSGEEVLETISSAIQKALKQELLIRLQATGHAVLIDAAAAVGQAAFADVLSAAGGVDVAAAVDQQVFPLTDVSELVREQRLALDGVPALTDLPTAVAQVEANLPGNAAAAICISDLQQRAIANRLLVLLQCAGEKVDQGQSEDDSQHPALPQQPP